MSKNRLFGTDGVRGIANVDLTAELAFNLGKAAAIVLNNNKDNKKMTFVVGRDTRISGDMLNHSIISGLLSQNVDVIDLGVIPTPAIAYLVKKYNATAGVMISASHNPYNYNGIKFFDNRGYKLKDSVEDEIQCIIESGIKDLEIYSDENLGKSIYYKSGVIDYISYIMSTVKVSFDGLNIALDCANGATSNIAEIIFKELGANVHCIHNAPNGININKNCGSTHMDDLRNVMMSGDYHIGFAFDGDGDRCLAIDNKGNIISGDKIMAICGLNLHKKNKLNKNTVVTTIMSNLGLHKKLNSLNIDTVSAKVGDRYVLEEMLKHGYNFGGEDSGHIIFLDHNTTGDGILTAVQMCYMLSKDKSAFDNISNIFEEYPQVLINIEVPNKIKHEILSYNNVSNVIANEESKLNGDGRVLVRVSGTEPLIRVMVEGPKHSLINSIAKNIVSEIKNTL